MSYPRALLFPPSVPLLQSCPSFGPGPGPGPGPGVLLGPRSEDLRSSSGSAFAPYSSPPPAPPPPPPAFSPTRLPFGAELSSFMAPSSFEPAPCTSSSSSSSCSSSLDLLALGALGCVPYGECGGYRKGGGGAGRDATAALKAWLGEHRRNPYPTKGEKIMLAIVTRMSLTQVSTWFANARRRLKKDNKMTWTPRHRSEDDEEEEEEAQHTHRQQEEQEEEQEEQGRGPKVSGGETRSKDAVLDLDLDFGDPSGPLPPLGSAPPPPPGPLSPCRDGVSCAVLQGPVAPRPRPKLWSLAEMITSTDRPGTGSRLPPALYGPSPLLPPYPSFTAQQGGPGANG